MERLGLMALVGMGLLMVREEAQITALPLAGVVLVLVAPSLMPRMAAGPAAGLAVAVQAMLVDSTAVGEAVTSTSMAAAEMAGRA